MTRAEYIGKYGKDGNRLQIISERTMTKYLRYQLYKKELDKGYDSQSALFIVAEDCKCEFITVYKSVSFFVNLRTKKEK